MNRNEKKELSSWLLVAALIIILLIAGRYDFNNAVMDQVPRCTYEAISKELGSKSRSDIVDEYLLNREKWDAYTCYGE